MKRQKKKYQTVAMISLLFICVACKSGFSHTNYYKSFDHVTRISSYSTHKHKSLILVQKFGVSNFFQLGIPYGIANLGHYVIVTDQSNKTIHTFKDTTHLRSISRYGNGPGEFQNIGSISSKPGRNSFWIYDATLFRFQKFSLNAITDSLGRKKYAQNIINVKTKESGYINRPIWLNDTTIISSGFFTRGRIAFFNDRGKFQENVGPPLPEIKDKTAPYKVRSHAYMGFMSAKPDGSAFVIADQYTDKIEIYNAQGHPLRLIIGARNFNPHYNVAHLSGGPTMEAGENMRIAYISVYSTEKRIYALYSGKLKKTKNHLGSSVHVFNWQGQLLDVYSLNSNSIIDISVDDSQGKMYTLDYSAKKPISIYKIPKSH